MSRAPVEFLAMLAVCALALFPACQSYDVLVQKNQISQQKFADLQAQLERRADLVPNLVATVKGSAKHEEDTLSAVTHARAEASGIQINPGDLDDTQKMKAFEDAQNKFSGALSRLLVVNEQYPDLKANQAYHDLQIQLEGTENRILRAREEYNATVSDFNTELGKIRGQVVNKVTGRPFQARAYFNASPASQEAPKVQF
ncbi:MAG: LemA family protein [Myxococcota bacterium]|nr:LemA family protein [Myxococcota bacterium]